MIKITRDIMELITEAYKNDIPVVLPSHFYDLAKRGPGYNTEPRFGWACSGMGDTSWKEITEKVNTDIWEKVLYLPLFGNSFD